MQVTCPIEIAPVNSPNMTAKKRTVVTPILRCGRGRRGEGRGSAVNCKVFSAVVAAGAHSSGGVVGGGVRGVVLTCLPWSATRTSRAASRPQ